MRGSFRSQSFSTYRASLPLCGLLDAESLTMRPLRSPPEDFEIRARARCRACGKTRELTGQELHDAASMDAFKELERRLRCSDSETSREGRANLSPRLARVIAQPGSWRRVLRGRQQGEQKEGHARLGASNLKNVARDEEARARARNFFEAAEEARLDGTVGEHGFTMRRSNIVFPHNEGLLQALTSLVVRCIDKLGSTVGNENDIQELAWEEAAECQSIDATIRGFFSKLGNPATYQATYIVSNYVCPSPTSKAVAVR